MRPGIEEWGLLLAEVVATRGTCLRRQVGCVLLDAEGRVLSTGYNGVARGRAHCNDRVLESPVDVGLSGAGLVGRKVTFPFACDGSAAASGTSLDSCQAIHAEANALLQCRAVDRIAMCCVTVSPCVSCVKLLMNTPCRTIVFRERYAHEEARNWWLAGNDDRAWVRLREGITPKAPGIAPEGLP